MPSKCKYCRGHVRGPLLVEASGLQLVGNPWQCDFFYLDPNHSARNPSSCPSEERAREEKGLAAVVHTLGLVSHHPLITLTHRHTLNCTNAYRTVSSFTFYSQDSFAYAHLRKHMLNRALVSCVCLTFWQLGEVYVCVSAYWVFTSPPSILRVDKRGPFTSNY